MQRLLRWQWEALSRAWRPASLLAGLAALLAAVLPPAASLQGIVFLGVAWALWECFRETRRLQETGFLERLSLTPMGTSRALAAVVGLRALALAFLAAPALAVWWGVARPAAPTPSGIPVAAGVQRSLATGAGIVGAALSAGAAGTVVALAVDHPVGRRAALLGAAGFLSLVLLPPLAGPLMPPPANSRRGAGGTGSYAAPGRLAVRGTPWRGAEPGVEGLPSGRWAVRNLLSGAASASLAVVIGNRRPQRR